MSGLYDKVVSMGKRKKKAEPNINPKWVISDSIQINGRSVTLGTELSIVGESGRFRFIKHVKTPDVEWIDVIGGKKGHEMWRSFGLDRVKTVHRINRTRTNLVGK
jgi:hypothetical protein